METQLKRIFHGYPSMSVRLLSALIIAAIFIPETKADCIGERQINLNTYTHYESIVTSPNYPSPYPVFCIRSYRVQAPSSSYIVRVEIVNLEVEFDSTCSRNSLNIYDGGSNESPRLARLCGYIVHSVDHPNYIFSHGPSLYVTFLSDGGNGLGSYRGFELKVRAVLIEDQAPGSWLPAVTWNNTANSLTWPTTELEARYYETEYLTSPGYPINYPPNYVHRWLIKARHDYFIKLTIFDLQIQHHPSCSFDNLTIYDAIIPNPNHVIQIAQLCSPVPSASIGSRDYYSSSSYLYLVFRTDSTGYGRGFKVGYQAVVTAGSPAECTSSNLGGLNIQALYGIAKYIESPNYPRNYGNNMNCGWLIRAPYGHVVHVRAEIMDLEPSGQCMFDSVRLYDATSANAFNMIARLCTINADIDYYSRNSYMYVTFTTDGSKTATGFRLMYQAALRSDQPVGDDDKTDSGTETVSSSGVGGAVAGVVVVVVAIVAISVCIVLVRRRTKRLRRQQQTSGQVSFTRASGNGPWPSEGSSCYAATNGAFDFDPPSYTELYPGPSVGTSDLALPGYSSHGLTGALDRDYQDLPPPPSYDELEMAAKAMEPTGNLLAPASTEAGHIAVAGVQPSAPMTTSV